MALTRPKRFQKRISVINDTICDRLPAVYQDTLHHGIIQNHLSHEYWRNDKYSETCL